MLYNTQSTLHCIIIITPWEFFTSALANGFSLEVEWQQVSSSLQDSSQNSGRSQQCCSLDGLHSSTYFHVLQFLYQSFGDRSKSTNYNLYNYHFHILEFLYSLVRSMYHLFAFFKFYSVVSWDNKVLNSANSLLFFQYCKLILQCIIIMVSSWEFFTSVLADGFSLESDWQQVSSSLQDYSHYSGRSQ